MVSGTVLAPEGVPLMPPVNALSDRPVCSVPLVIDHVYGGVPPVAFKGSEHATPTVHEARDVVVIARLVFTCKGNVTGTACGVGEQLSVAVKVGVNGPDTEGVPEIN